MSNYCPTCGFPHNHARTDVIPYLAREHQTEIEDFTDDELQCRACGRIAARWIWNDPLVDGCFDWYDAASGDEL